MSTQTRSDSARIGKVDAPSVLQAGDLFRRVMAVAQLLAKSAAAVDTPAEKVPEKTRE